MGATLSAVRCEEQPFVTSSTMVAALARNNPQRKEIMDTIHQIRKYHCGELRKDLATVINGFKQQFADEAGCNVEHVIARITNADPLLFIDLSVSSLDLNEADTSTDDIGAADPDGGPIENLASRMLAQPGSFAQGAGI